MRRKIIPDRNPNLLEKKKMKSTADDNYIGKHMGFPYYY